MQIRRWIAAATAAMSVTLPMAATSSAVADSSYEGTNLSTGASTTSTADAAVLASADQLAQDYGVSLDDAVARIEAQPAVDQLGGFLEGNDPSFAGLYTDQANGGDVVVMRSSSADDAMVAAESSELGLAQRISLSPVAYSLSYLRQVVGLVVQTIKSLPSSDVNYLPVVDVSANAVAIYSSSQGVDALATSAWFKSLKAANLPVFPALIPTAVSDSCDFPVCGPPLRGGLAIVQGAGWAGNAYCTAGFTVLGPSGNPWMLTAGHCGVSNWYTINHDTGNWHKVGSSDSAHQIHDSSLDAELIAYDDQAAMDFWGVPNNQIFQTDTPGGRPTVPDYHITTEVVSGPYQGDYLCHTGATGGTHCGSVTDADTPVDEGSLTINHAVQIEGIACNGDSGGPVYNQGTAYGIEVASYPKTTTVTGPNGVDQNCTQSTGHFYFMKIQRIESQLNVSVYLNS